MSTGGQFVNALGQEMRQKFFGQIVNRKLERVSRGERFDAPELVL